MKYENLDIWHRSTTLSINVYKSFSSLRDYGFKDLRMTTMDGGNAENAGVVFCQNNTFKLINTLKYSRGLWQNNR